MSEGKIIPPSGGSVFTLQDRAAYRQAIARDCLTTMLGRPTLDLSSVDPAWLAGLAVGLADALLAELRK